MTTSKNLSTPQPTENLYIVIAGGEAGFVFRGYCEDIHDPKGVQLTDADNLRIWGTTAGLGQIAISGYTKETIADKYGDVFVPRGAFVLAIKCLVK